MPSILTVVYWAFAALAIIAAGLCITRRNPIVSALWLVQTLFCVAVLFTILHAPFIGVLQVLVYAGAIMVLFLFVIMLLNLGRSSGDLKGLVASAVGAVLGVGLLLDLRPIGHAAPPDAIVLPAGAIDSMLVHQGVVGSVAGPLFDTYLVPFEITSLLLTAAIVGAVVLAKRKL
ncbi:MAG TPA: NADH-quinone oxidoreductase subunit J [Gemmatimonadales bacterium]|nr:NADH-quinone oxidoreductase subunit J [Gemmatimonadales bacterium]